MGRALYAGCLLFLYATVAGANGPFDATAPVLAPTAQVDDVGAWRVDWFLPSCLSARGGDGGIDLFDDGAGGVWVSSQSTLGASAWHVQGDRATRRLHAAPSGRGAPWSQEEFDLAVERGDLARANPLRTAGDPAELYELDDRLWPRARGACAGVLTPSGDLWMTTQAGLFLVTGDCVDVFPNIQPQVIYFVSGPVAMHHGVGPAHPVSEATRLACDASGRLWVHGPEFGLLRASSPQAQHAPTWVSHAVPSWRTEERYTNQARSLDDYVQGEVLTVLRPGKGNTMLLGTESGRLTVLAHEEGGTLPPVVLSETVPVSEVVGHPVRVTDLLIDSADRLWVSYEHPNAAGPGGVAYRDNDGWHDVNWEAVGLLRPPCSVSSLCEVAPGRVWAGIDWRCRAGVEPGGQFSDVPAIIECSCPSDGGAPRWRLLRINGLQSPPYSLIADEPTNEDLWRRSAPFLQVKRIVEDAEDRIWIATEGGLARLTPVR